MKEEEVMRASMLFTFISEVIEGRGGCVRKKMREGLGVFLREIEGTIVARIEGFVSIIVGLMRL